MTLTAVPELISPPAAETRAPRWMTGWRLMALWMLSGVCIFAFIGTPTVTRTQEARVLETAREMLDEPNRLDNWLIPELNGVARLRKPPLPYWFAAIAFMTAGVDEGVGRVPTAILAWLLIGMTFRIADRLLDRRKAFFAAATLAGSLLFYRHARLAETDMPAALFVTGAIVSFLLAAETRRAGWHYLAAICIGLAFNAKGPPGLFPLIFLLAYAAVERRWKFALQFITSGAILVALVLSASWFVYAGTKIGWTQFRAEMQEVGAGEGHNAPFYFYIPLVVQTAAPWSLIGIAGIIAAIVRWKSDSSLRTVLIWFAAIFVPLSITPQKQPHYALPMMPPFMLLVGWAIDVACGGRASPASRGRRDLEVQAAVPVTFIGLALAAVAGVPVGARVILHHIRAIDWVLAAILAALVAVPLFTWFRRSKVAGASAFAGAVLLALPLLLGYWYPGLAPANERDIAAKARELSPAGPYYFYEDMHLPLVFYLQRPVPMAGSPQRLETMLDRDAAEKSACPLIIAEIRKSGSKESLQRPPAEVANWRLTRCGEVRLLSSVYEMYRAERR